MLGLGVGMVFATAIMMVPDSSQDKMSDAEVKERALELGMIEREDALDQVLAEKGTPSAKPETSVEPENTGEVEASDAPTVEPTTKNSYVSNKKTTSAQTTATERVEVTETPKITGTPEVTKKPSKSEQISYVTLEIKAGMWSEEIAATLHSLDLVDDAQEFDKFLCDNGYGSKIKVGTYKIPTGSTYTQIAEIITN